MFFSKVLPAALLTASIIPSAMAAECYAEGLHRVTGSNIERFIKIQTGDSTFLYTQEPEGEDVCGTAKLQSRRPSNLRRIKGDGILRNPLQWQGDCGESGFQLVTLLLLVFVDNKYRC